MIASRWDEVHVRRDVPHHAMRLHAATEFELTDLEDEPAELEQLRWARWVHAEAAQLVEAAVIDARRTGASWSTIGAVLGVHKQTAWERYRALDAEVQDPEGRMLSLGTHDRGEEVDWAQEAPLPAPEPTPTTKPVHNPPKKSRRKRK